MGNRIHGGWRSLGVCVQCGRMLRINDGKGGRTGDPFTCSDPCRYAYDMDRADARAAADGIRAMTRTQMTVIFICAAICGAGVVTMIFTRQPELGVFFLASGVAFLGMGLVWRANKPKGM